jgi:hypothetical protein
VLNAKFFAGLAGIALVVAILGRVRAIPRGNLWLRVANISFGTFYWQLFIALVCALLALAYFGIVRAPQRPLDQTIGLVGFFLVAFATVVGLISSFLTTSNSPMSRGLAILLFAAIFSFISGVALSAANVAWVLLRK